jgi:hypothetical protein
MVPLYVPERVVRGFKYGSVVTSFHKACDDAAYALDLPPVRKPVSRETEWHESEPKYLAGIQLGTRPGGMT